MSSPRRLSIALLGLLILVLMLAPASLPAQTTQDSITKVVGLMRANGYDFKTTRSDTVWVIHFPGDHLKDIKVVLAVENDTQVTFVTVVEKRRMPVNTNFMRTLLEQNHKMDRVKVGFDADGDLSVRIDSTVHITDKEEFRAIVTQVKAASDEIYGMIESDLLP